jgi:hypothetical protein
MIHEAFAQHKMTPQGAELSNAIKECASEMLSMLEKIPYNRESSLAKTKLEEAVMWANKAIAKEVEL